MDLVSEIRRIAAEKLSPAQFLIDVVLSAKRGPKKVLIIVDGDNGITIDECAELSRQVAKELEERNLIDDNYLLEVTSPGVDQPLTLQRQYQKNIGRALKIRMGDQQLEGKLAEVRDGKIVLTRQVGSGKKLETITTEIDLNNIQKAFVQVSFK
jgi:ribosome maturation factor RimP